MAHGVPNSDWRIFRDLRELALDRFCKRVLDEVERLTKDSSGSHHERYRELYRVVHERDEELARAFDDPRRSRMLWQLAAIHRHGLLEADEFARFSAETREAIESLAKEPRW
jgi:hypothetical protein